MSLTFWNAVVVCYGKNILKEFQISLEPLSVRVKVESGCECEHESCDSLKVECGFLSAHSNFYIHWTGEN